MELRFFFAQLKDVLRFIGICLKKTATREDFLINYLHHSVQQLHFYLIFRIKLIIID